MSVEDSGQERPAWRPAWCGRPRAERSLPPGRMVKFSRGARAEARNQHDDQVRRTPVITPFSRTGGGDRRPQGGRESANIITIRWPRARRTGHMAPLYIVVQPCDDTTAPLARGGGVVIVVKGEVELVTEGAILPAGGRLHALLIRWSLTTWARRTERRRRYRRHLSPPLRWTYAQGEHHQEATIGQLLDEAGERVPDNDAVSTDRDTARPEGVRDTVDKAPRVMARGSKGGEGGRVGDQRPSLGYPAVRHGEDRRPYC